MTLHRSTSAQTLVKILLPSILIVIGFLWFVRRPLQQLIAIRSVNFVNIQTNVITSPTALVDLRRQLDDVRQELSVTANKLSLAKNRIESIGQKKMIRGATFVHANTRATTVASTLELLRRNHLICLVSQSMAIKSAKPDAAIKSSADAETNATFRKEVQAVNNYCIRLRGRFQDIRVALQELHDEMPEIIPVSIEMQEPSTLDDCRNWILIIGV